jgi:hypothetical protein
VNGIDQPTTPYATSEYPPAEWATNRAFKAPGPVSRQLANYFAMCAPSSKRRSRRAQLAANATAANH